MKFLFKMTPLIKNLIIILVIIIIIILILLKILLLNLLMKIMVFSVLIVEKIIGWVKVNVTLVLIVVGV